ncbi:MAG: hypothetical protein FJY79_03525 [Candidatus Aminicenantes bacterium]|nr:hypothetical protein [Candidatus Aminicenantes bacterium]
MTIGEQKSAIDGSPGRVECPGIDIDLKGGAGNGLAGPECQVYVIRKMLDYLGTSPGQFETMITSLLSMYLCREQRHPWKTFIGSMERSIIISVLCHTNGNQRDASRILGLKFSTLNAKIKRHRIHIAKPINIHSSFDGPSADEHLRGTP